MNSSKSNVIVYVRNPVRQGQSREISAGIGNLYGVVSAVNSTRTENAICVDYDPAVIDAARIIGFVQGQGVTARLVGM